MNTYIGVFTLALDDPESTFTTGHLTAVVEAEDVSTALDKFRGLLLDAKHRERLFHPVKRVFLPCCSELSAIPANGLITYLQLTDAGGVSINTSNVQRSTMVTSFGYGAADSTVDEPFMEFE